MVEQINNLKNSIDQVKDWINLDKCLLTYTHVYVNVTLHDHTVKAPFSWSIENVYTPSIVV